MPDGNEFDDFGFKDPLLSLCGHHGALPLSFADLHIPQFCLGNHPEDIVFDLIGEAIGPEYHFQGLVPRDVIELHGYFPLNVASPDDIDPCHFSDQFEDISDVGIHKIKAHTLARILFGCGLEKPGPVVFGSRELTLIRFSGPVHGRLLTGFCFFFCCYGFGGFLWRRFDCRRLGDAGNLHGEGIKVDIQRLTLLGNVVRDERPQGYSQGYVTI